VSEPSPCVRHGLTYALEYLKMPRSRVRVMRILHLATIAVLAVVVLAAVACQSTDTLQLAIRKFRDKYDAVQNEMTEQDVAAVFAGYPPGRREDQLRGREVGLNGEPLSKPSAYAMIYVEKENAVEQDHCIWVFFDKDGYVVGKSWSVIMR
jgi:hypothetical protein